MTDVSLHVLINELYTVTTLVEKRLWQARLAAAEEVSIELTGDGGPLKISVLRRKALEGGVEEVRQCWCHTLYAHSTAVVYAQKQRPVYAVDICCLAVCCCLLSHTPWLDLGTFPDTM